MGALAEAVAAMPDVQMAIKTHPAETPDVYRAVAHHRSNIRVLPSATPLAPLLRASRAIVTVNSTVALDAAVLGVPALVIGLPNNLSPFVDAGIMAGAATGADIAPALGRILYDEGFRLQMERSRDEYDEVLEVDYELAYSRALDLARTEGLLAGPSSGLIFERARRVIERDRVGVGVVIFPDNVFKYVSNMVKHAPQLTEGTQPR
jgi:hypothetical protein